MDFGGIHVWPDNWEMCASLPLLQAIVVRSDCFYKMFCASSNLSSGCCGQQSRHAEVLRTHGCRKQKKFLVKWVTDHMEDSEENIHKPLLLEEFGKIVWEKDFVKGMIEKKRNPVYEAMTGVTTDSVYR